MAPSFVITDWLLFNHALTPRARSVAGYTLQCHGQNPSISILAELLSMRRQAVHDAQDELEAHGICVYRRAKRHAGNNEANKLIQVASEAQIRHRSWFSFVPAPLLEGLTELRNGHVFPLVLALYAYEQRRRGAIQMQNKVAAALLGLTNDQVKRARATLIHRGKLTVVRRAKPSDVMRLACIPSGRTFDPQMTLRLQQLDLDDRKLPIKLVTMDDQFGMTREIAHRMAPENVRAAAIRAARKDGHGNPSKEMLAHVVRKCQGEENADYAEIRLAVLAGDDPEPDGRIVLGRLQRRWGDPRATLPIPEDAEQGLRERLITLGADPSDFDRR